MKHWSWDPVLSLHSEQGNVEQWAEHLYVVTCLLIEFSEAMITECVQWYLPLFGQQCVTYTCPHSNVKGHTIYYFIIKMSRDRSGFI